MDELVERVDDQDRGLGMTVSRRQAVREGWLHRVAVDALYPGIGLEADNQAARERHITKHPWLHRVRLRYIWTALHVGIALTGVVLTAVIALSPAW
ncbi:hypothetical protein [Streptomyces phaeochromogenes]